LVAVTAAETVGELFGAGNLRGVVFRLSYRRREFFPVERVVDLSQLHTGVPFRTGNGSGIVENHILRLFDLLLP
jgi:hypothetical protein